MTELQALAPQSRAVLSLVLAQSKGYEEIAELLRMDPADVRARAQAAALQVSPPPAAIDVDDRAAIVDYLLGQDSVSARVRVRGLLRDEDVERGWAHSLSDALAPLARDPLPAIPEPVVGEHAEKPPRRSAWPRGGRLVAGLAVLALALVALILVLSSGTGHRRAQAVHKPPPRRTSTRRAPNVQTIRRLVLVPTSADPHALGAGAVVRQSGSLLLLLQARGLAPNHNDSYGVWLFNAPGDSRLLGFVSPAVGPAGTFSSGVALPDDAIRFHSLIVTRETTSRPASPGRTVLRGPLSLS